LIFYGRESERKPLHKLFFIVIWEQQAQLRVVEAVFVTIYIYIKRVLLVVDFLPHAALVRL
jgi:hypothetical protein